MRNPNALIVTSVVMILVFAVASCTPLKIKKPPTQKVSGYKFMAQRNGLSVSIDPYKEEGRLKEFFGGDLLSRGILPVFILVENVSAEDGYIINSDKTSLLTASSVSAKEQVGEGQKNDEVAKARKSFQSANEMASVVPLFGVVGLAFLPFGLVSEKKYRDEIEIRKNLENNQLLPKTIYEGGSQSGFLYFNIGKEVEQVRGIQIVLKNIRTKELLSVTVAMGNL
jgi:hypothetical protein